MQFRAREYQIKSEWYCRICLKVELKVEEIKALDTHNSLIEMLCKCSNVGYNDFISFLLLVVK